MKHARLLGTIFACLLGACDVAAEDRSGAETDGPNAAAFVDPLRPVFDVHQWTAVQSAFVKFGNKHPTALVQLLKSITATGTDGTRERHLYSVNLIVVEDGRLLYSYAPLAVPPFDPRQTDSVFYMDDFGNEAGCPLEIRDVTGDQVPEIIFHSGMIGVSDSQTDIHILQYTNTG